MSAFAFSLVISAAVLHAIWNAIVKSAVDRTVILGLVALGQVIPGAILITILPFPGWEAMAYVGLSTVIHFGYFLMLGTAYRHGDLSVVYAIARGSAPVLVTLWAQLLIGEVLPFWAWIGILCVALGILTLSKDVLKGHVSKMAVWSALGTGLCISSYSVVDGIGVRLSAHTISYVAWGAFAHIFITGFVFITRWERVRAIPRSAAIKGLLGGVVSIIAYGLVLQAKYYAPLGMVSAIRESSVIFAALIGVFFFHERPISTRLIAATIVACGIVLIGLNGA
ncbi:DMT family transporter [Cochlodiniinecator piscidefendens]|uniref:DMT family transporter n=1 Tax=Cochlodiniinecator piscidefendens TaxID=2715756 RepID=UPI00140AFC41|nr:DMT family transporter [Cochlodiniinecator piscidefendens]